ncbi:hypothetical protein FR943_11705 [Mycobacterium sp. TNTM28]|uniref:Lipoprotein n=1 Tax=[Mycobacterium] fortunisiensis TaxID=2600579 RepID=A0ABS6KLP6_9MYCO|nr:hypothetical protein [[Mycobacterium] fortunisiensis]MBU9764507.1 hypothetical protein [[Mycobacterium] fortunisiensis]
MEARQRNLTAITVSLALLGPVGLLAGCGGAPPVSELTETITVTDHAEHTTLQTPTTPRGHTGVVTYTAPTPTSGPTPTVTTFVQAPTTSGPVPTTTTFIGTPTLVPPPSSVTVTPPTTVPTDVPTNVVPAPPAE